MSEVDNGKHGVRLTVLSTVHRSPIFTMRGKYGPGALDSRIVSPGPFAYSYKSMFNGKDPSAVPRQYFGSSSREVRPKTAHFPSPVSYNPESFMTKPLHCVFGKDKRNPSYIPYRPAPSPDAYNVPSPRCGSPAYSFAAKLAERPRTVSPPPTAYNVNKTSVLEAPRWKFGTSRRTGIPSATAPTNPGPGRYNPVESSILHKSPAFSLKDRVRVSGYTGPDPDSPSPVAYGDMAATSSSGVVRNNPFTPPSSYSSEDVLDTRVSLEEGLARSQLKGMRSVEKKFTEVETLYKGLHGEAVSQQDAIDIVEASTLKTALLTGETVGELKTFKKSKDKRLRLRVYCVCVFLFILALWVLLVVGLPRE